MGTLNNKFFDDLANKATWSAGVAFKRSNPLPIDRYSVFDSIAAAETYASTSAVAYPGQVVAAIDTDANKMVVFVLTEVADVVEEGAEQTYHLALDRVGIVPTGDDKSIEVTADGVISLLGAGSAQNGTLPMIGDNGKLVWKTLEDIGAGDGNDNTTYEFTPLLKGEGDAAEIYGFSVQPFFNGQPIVEDGETVIYELAFDVYTKSEIDAKFGAVDTALAGVYTKTEADELFAPADDYALTSDLSNYVTTDAFNTAIGGKADAATTYSKDDVDGLLEDKADVTTVTGINERLEEVEAFFELAEGESLNDALDTLKEIQDYLDTEGTAADELTKTVGAHTTALETLNGDANTVGSVANAVAAETTRATGAEEALGKRIDDLAAIDNATQEELDAYKGEVSTALAGKVSNGDFDSYKNGVADALSKKANTADVYAKAETYSADEIDTLLENIQAGSSESAASVNTKLEAYKKVINNELYGNDEGTGDSRIDALEAVGAEANKIDAVKAREGITENGPSMLTVTTENKVVTIDDSAIVGAIATNRQSVEALSSSVDQRLSTINSNIGTNASNIEALTGRMTTAEGNINTNTGAIAALDTRVSSAEGKIGALETSVAGKADQTALNALSEALGTTNGTITTLTERVAADEVVLAGKLNTSDFNTAIAGYYTKSEVYSKDEANAAFIAASRDAELVALIGDASNAAVAAHGAADAIYKNVEGVESGVLVTKLANYKTSSETDAAIASAIAAIDHLKKKIVDSVNEDGMPVVDGEVIAIDANTIYMVHVESATGDQYKEYMQVGDGLVLIGDTSIDLADYITSGELSSELANYVTSASLPTVAVTSVKLGNGDALVGNVTIGYAGVNLPGLAAADGVTIAASTNGTLSVKAVSTDLLTQGENELRLVGGTASN